MLIIDVTTSYTFTVQAVKEHKLRKVFFRVVLLFFQLRSTFVKRRR